MWGKKKKMSDFVFDFALTLKNLEDCEGDLEDFDTEDTSSWCCSGLLWIVIFWNLYVGDPVVGVKIINGNSAHLHASLTLARNSTTKAGMKTSVNSCYRVSNLRFFRV
jgi:hypothetical protein